VVPFGRPKWLQSSSLFRDCCIAEIKSPIETSVADVALPFDPADAAAFESVLLSLVKESMAIAAEVSLEFLPLLGLSYVDFAPVTSSDKLLIDDLPPDVITVPNLELFSSLSTIPDSSSVNFLTA
jgi:hypothetical protein